MTYGIVGFRAHGPGGQAWSTMPVGGGGYMDGIDIAPDGTTIARSDTHPGLYLKSGSVWLPLLSSTSMPSTYVGTRNNTDKLAVGIWDARLAPSLTSKIYMITVDPAGKLFMTTNSGGSWVELTAFPTQGNLESNDSYRGYNYRMAVDPQNDQILFVGTLTGGLQRTLDSGQNWSTRTVGSGTGTSGVGMFIAFDPTSSVSSGAKQGLFVARNGDGVYHSTDGGGTFTKLNTTGMPTTFTHIMVDQNGLVYVVEDTPGQSSGPLWTWTSGGGWVKNAYLNTNGITVHSMDVDPSNASRIAIAAGGGGVYTSTNAGSSFNNVYSDVTVSGTDAPWMNVHQVGGIYFITDGKIKFDTQVAGKLWQTWGFGMMFAPNAFASTSAIAFTTSVKGIEGLDATSIIHPPGGNPIGTGYDVPIWNFTSYVSAPSEYKPEGYNNGLNPQSVPTSRGYALDYSKSDPSFIVSITGLVPISGNNYRGFKSTNKGVNWLPFGDQSPSVWTNAFGSIAASTNVNFMVQTGDGTYYTINGGSACTVDPLTINSFSYTSATGIVSLTLASSPVYPAPLSRAPAIGEPMWIELTATPYTISSGTYNNSTGVVVLTLSPSPSFATGANVTVNITAGSGDNLYQVGGYRSGTVSGSTMTYTIASGLNTPNTISITGGNVDVISSNIAFTNVNIASISGGTITLSGPTGLGTLASPVATNAHGTTFWKSTYAGNNGAYPFSHGQKFVCADPNTANKFLMISASGDGIYSSTNSGATFSKISSFSAASVGFDQKILGIPGQSGHFLLTGGYLDNATPPQPGGALYRSTDGGVNWTSISNVGEVWCMDYGTTVSGQSYPTIYFAGWANRGSGLEFGVWKTIDNFSTFTLLGGTSYPMGWFSLIADIAGDKSVDGACSIAYFGGGFKTFR